jgi:AbrB family looped-hinge helix DNA binding protein
MLGHNTIFPYTGAPALKNSFYREDNMTTLTISATGKIHLPADIRRRLGLVAGTQIEIIEESDGLRLVACPQTIKPMSVAACVGMVTAPTKGKPRRLEDFDAATLTAKAEV